MYESASPAHNLLLPQLQLTLGHAPAGLFTDVDGTISPIAPEPHLAAVLPEARLALDELRSRLAVVGVVSGRPLASLRNFVGVPGLVYVGNHGFEMLDGGEPTIIPNARPWLPVVQQAAMELAPTLAEPGVLLEDKGITLSLHYRLAADHAAARLRILAAIDASPAASRLLAESGRMVVNLLPPVPASKGSALRTLATAFDLRSLVYFGDDLTDVTAFKALADLRQEGRHTLSVAVAAQEAAPEVAAAADLAVARPEDVARVLLALARDDDRPGA